MATDGIEAWARPHAHSPRVPVPIAAQTWRDLIYVHWNVDAADVRAHVPRELVLDTLPDGRAVISLVAFCTEDARPQLFPRPLGIDFSEVNVRTYVRAPGHGRGVYFLSLDAGSRAMTALGRALLGLPYYLARLEHRRVGDAIGFRGHRRTASVPARRLSLLVEPRRELGHEPDFERFVHERYTAYWPSRRGMRCIALRHEPLPVVRAHVCELDETLTHAAGIDVKRSVPSAYYVEHVDVAFFAPEHVATPTHRRFPAVAAARG